MKFNARHTELTLIQHQLDIEVPWDEFEKFIPKSLEWFRTNVEIPGFRKGKASIHAVRSKIAERIPSFTITCTR